MNLSHSTDLVDLFVSPLYILPLKSLLENTRQMAIGIDLGRAGKEKLLGYANDTVVTSLVNSNNHTIKTILKQFFYYFRKSNGEKLNVSKTVAMGRAKLMREYH